MSETPTVAIVGSGPIGSAYARVLLESHPDVRVIMLEAGPQLTETPGESVRNIADPDGKARAREMSQGPQAGALRESLDDAKRVFRTRAEQAEEARVFAGWMREAGAPNFIKKQGLQLQL